MGFCEAGLTCVENFAVDVPYVCAPTRREGETCLTAQQACDQWLTCTDGVCVAFDPTTCN